MGLAWRMSVEELVGWQRLKVTMRSPQRLRVICPWCGTSRLSMDRNADLFYCGFCDLGGDPIKFVQLIGQVRFATTLRLVAQAVKRMR